MSHRWTALCLLLAGLFSMYLWQFGNWPRAVYSQVWNLSGAGYRILLLSLLGVAYRSTAVRLVCLLLAMFDLMVLGCSAAFLYSPWPIVEGESCSARLNMPLGVLGAILGLAVLLSIVRHK